MTGRRILITGSLGQVGFELQSALSPLGDVLAVDRSGLDLGSADSIRACVRQARPRVIVNAAGFTNVDEAESCIDAAMQINGTAPGVLAEEAKRIGAVLVHYSTDYVFDGNLDRPYTEEDEPNPVNVYGQSKLAGERAITAAGGMHLILRTSWVYSDRRRNFVLSILRLAQELDELTVVTDQTGSPNWARELAQTTARLLREQELVAENPGIYHLSAAGTTSRYEFAKAILLQAEKHDSSLRRWARLIPSTSEHYSTVAKRPLRLETDKSKIRRVFGIEMPHWRTQLEAYMSNTSLGVARAC